MAISPPDILSNPTIQAGSELPLPAVDIVSFAFHRIDSLNPDTVIFADADQPESCILARDVRSKVSCLSTVLKARGVQRGDCVCIHSFNSIWYPLLWLAIIASGGIVTGSNPAYTPSELVHHFTISNTKFVVAQPECVAAVKEALSKCDVSVRNLIVLGKGLVTGDDLNSVNLAWQTSQIESDIHHRHVFDDEEVQDSTIAVYAATSGTTGLPKVAELSHKYVVAQVSILEHVLARRLEEIRQLVCLPIFHAFAAQLSIILPLRLGVTTYFMPRFNLAEYLYHVQQFQITDTAVVPPIVSALTSTTPGILDSLRYIICAGAPMTASVQTKLYSKLNSMATISQCWGTTELGWVTVFDQSERDLNGSVGRLLPNTALKIVDPLGQTITSDNVSGEALVKSASMMKRYRNSPAADMKAFDHEGYYRTGDRVYVQNGKIFITGRIKDTLKVNGWQVSPEEIESVVLELKNVMDCAVAGHSVISERTGLEETKPRAFIVRRLGSTLLGHEVQHHVKERLIRYKRLTGGVVFVDTIPRSNTGKIQRLKLLDIPLEQLKIENETLDTTTPLWNHCALAVVFIPFCIAMGVPGLILLTIGFRRALAVQGHRA